MVGIHSTANGIGALDCALDALKRCVDSQHVGKVFRSLGSEYVACDAAKSKVARWRLARWRQGAGLESCVSWFPNASTSESKHFRKQALQKASVSESKRFRKQALQKASASESKHCAASTSRKQALCSQHFKESAQKASMPQSISAHFSISRP